MSVQEDRFFDLGQDGRGFFVVEDAQTSTIPNRIFSDLRWEQLMQLRNEIDAALQIVDDGMDEQNG